MEEDLNTLTQRQVQLRNEVKVLKKRIPTIVFGVLLSVLTIDFLFEEKASSFVGSSINLLYYSGILLVLIVVPFWFLTKKMIKKRQAEIKIISSKVYELMKLQS